MKARELFVLFGGFFCYLDEWDNVFTFSPSVGEDAQYFSLRIRFRKDWESLPIQSFTPGSGR